MEIHCAGAKSRLHSTSAPLRKAKVKEYQHFVTQTVYQKIQRDTVGHEQTAPTTSSEAQLVRDSFASYGMTAPCKPASQALANAAGQVKKGSRNQDPIARGDQTKS